MEPFTLRPSARRARLFALAGLCALTTLAGGAQAQTTTWARGRATPRLRELVVIDRTGEPGWLFGAEDVAGDGLDAFEEAERSVDLRTAYARTASQRLWLRAYLSSETAPTAELRVFFFLDVDQNPDTGGSSEAPEIDPAFDTDSAPGGYEYVLGVAGDTAVAGVWRYDRESGAYEEVELPPLAAVAESGTDRDPLRREEAERAYVQVALDFEPIELTASCSASLLIRSLPLEGRGDLDMGAVAPCVPRDTDANAVPDLVEQLPDPRCSVDSDCPAHAVCVGERCVHPGYCDADADCAAGERCTSDGLCLARGGESCEPSVGCQAGLVCSSAGQCRACDVDGACAAGLRCAASGRCVDADSPSGSTPSGAGSREGGVVLLAGEEVQGGACACRLAGARSPRTSRLHRWAFGLLWLAAVARGRRRRRRAAAARWPVLLLALGLWLIGGSAGAQVDAERFDPAVTHDGWLSAEGSAVRHPQDRWELGAWLSYAHHPLIIADESDDLSRAIVDGRLGLTLLASLSLTEQFAVGLGVPAFGQSGEGLGVAGLGDVRLVPKLELASDADDGFGFALAADLRLPTHTGDFAGGAGNVEIFPKAIVDHRFRGGVRIGANAGAVLRQSQSFLNVTQGTELAGAIALGYRFGGLAGKTELGAELDAALLLAGASDEETALEARGFVRHDLTQEWRITGGVGAGLLAGYGVPVARVFFGLTYAPTSHDSDGDGVADDKDECDEYREDLDAYEDGDGCPEEDPDRDGDGVSDFDDECPESKETINGIQDHDGCPDVGPGHVRFVGGRFEISETIEFSTGSDEIQPNPHPLLDELALSMRAHPEARRIRIAGHTDDTGSREFNMALSEHRARSVKRYLVEHGVSPRRLRVESYGPDRPLDAGTGAAARARNRRVEFVAE